MISFWSPKLNITVTVSHCSCCPVNWLDPHNPPELPLFQIVAFFLLSKSSSGNTTVNKSKPHLQVLNANYPCGFPGVLKKSSEQTENLNWYLRLSSSTWFIFWCPPSDSHAQPHWSEIVSLCLMPCCCAHWSLWAFHVQLNKAASFKSPRKSTLTAPTLPGILFRLLFIQYLFI